MRINRRFLYWGVFLVAIGVVLVAADVGGLDSGSIADGLRLWPLALVAIGVGIVIRRTRFSLAGGMLAAALPGLALGGGLAIVPRIAVDCGGNGALSTVAARDGVFDGPARVTITTGCGTLDVTTGPGSAWHFADGNTTGRAAIVDATSRSLSIDFIDHDVDDEMHLVGKSAKTRGNRVKPRLQFCQQTDKFLCRKFYRRMFGEKVDHFHSPQIGVEVLFTVRRKQDI